MVRNSKHRNPNGASSNNLPPDEEKKQTKVTKAKETEPKVIGQTKPTFPEEPQCQTAAYLLQQQQLHQKSL
jgi:hypothetical protein